MLQIGIYKFAKWKSGTGEKNYASFETMHDRLDANQFLFWEKLITIKFKSISNLDKEQKSDF